MKHQCENHAKCMQMIQAVLDGSATPEEVEHFKTHMHDCMPCIDGYQLEKSIKEAMQAKVEKKCCPQATLMTINIDDNQRKSRSCYTDYRFHFYRNQAILHIL
ncbi:MAG: hypothetical protein MUF45_10650 [Spirosomaceae bacterium]|nr:hypothetical protein [Spirosomataceae bacterium]